MCPEDSTKKLEMICEICNQPRKVLIMIKVIEDEDIVQKDVCPGCPEEMTL